MSPGGSVSGAFGFTAPLAALVAAAGAAELEEELDDDPHPPITAATANRSTAGAVRMGPPLSRGLIAADLRRVRVSGGCAKVSAR